SFGGPVLFLLNKYVIFSHVIRLENNVDYVVILSSIALTTALWITVAPLTKPDPDAELIELYTRARPLGWWGPIAEKAGLAPKGSMPIAQGLGAAVVGMVMVAAGTIAFSTAYIAQWKSVASFGAVCVACGLLF